MTHSSGFKSASGGVLITHDGGSINRSSSYQITAGDRVLGRVRSIIDAGTVKNVPGLPVDQEVFWSPSGNTALIYENMSDASPDYQYILIRIGSDSRSFEASRIDFGTRHASQEDIYGHWPSVRGITDEEVELEWSSEPTVQKVRIAELPNDSEPLGGSGPGE